MSRIPELDGLRAIAISAVLCVHFYPPGYPGSNLTALGWSGVDLFFAVSGFLITGILLSLRGRESPYKTFYWRRALRIFPPYYLVFVLIETLTLLHRETPTRNEQIAAGFLLSSLARGFSPHLMWSRLFLHSGFHVPVQPLFHHGFEEFRYAKGIFWSLSVEELFYFLWAPVMLRGSRRFVLWFCIAPLLVCPVFRALNHVADFPEAFSFPCRFDSLAAGGCVALLFAAVKRGHLSQQVFDRSIQFTIPLTSLSLILMVWRCGAFEGTEVRSALMFAVFGYSLLALLCAAIVAACARWSSSGWMGWLRLRPLLQLGTISYMVYLIHIPLYTAAGVALVRVGVRSNLLLLRGVVALPVAIGFAALSWHYFETPILALKDRRFAMRNAPVAPSSTPADGPVIAA
jgi:peptidoglycan/LPS O-acetylase OafA/YrhL